MELLKDLKEVNAIELFIAYFIPGFISIKVFELFVPSAPLEWEKRVPEVAGYSAVYYAASLWILNIVPSDQKGLATYFVVFVFPVLVGLLAVTLRGGSLRIKQHVLPTPWDVLFARLSDGTKFADGAIIRLTLKNGSGLIGFYGGVSYASTYPNEGQLYLQAVCVQNTSDDLRRKQPYQGLLINASEVAYATVERATPDFKNK